jgi:hypothetical protein
VTLALRDAMARGALKEARRVLCYVADASSNDVSFSVA